MSKLSLTVRCDATSWGESVAVLGSWNNWDHNSFTPLTTTPTTYPSWSASLSIPTSHQTRPLEYKYLIVNNNHIVRWETSSRRNRLIHASSSSATLSSSDIFGSIPNLPDSSAPPSDLAPTPAWHQSSSSAVPNNYDGSLLDPLERAIVRLTQDRGSWRQRLSFVRSLFTDDAVSTEVHFDPHSLDALATVAIYVSFLSTGQVRCQEDGGHHRPNHHANEARQIDAALASVIHQARNIPHSKNAYLPCVARRIFPQLPSYSSQFTVSVPLTRIRDIAHRGDIPKDLKLDIKHNLQNKLHRCAGPEDLHTSARILEQISHGGYSHPFVEQFRIFHSELLAFFNASSLDDRLRYLASNPHTTQLASLANQLLSVKQASATHDIQLAVLTDLRITLATLPLMQPPSDPTNLPSEDVQKVRLADIDLESYAFVLLAADAKAVEHVSSSFPWPRATHALGLAMRHIALSSIRPIEAEAIASELHVVSPLLQTSSSSRNLLHRARAAIDRASRFAHAFSSALTDVYERRVATLGAALGVDRRATAVFAEAEIRSALTFQASRLADACARAARTALSLPPWDPLHAGETIGELVFADELDRAPSGRGNHVIVVARHADGDEDVPKHVKGIILGRALPHLSHLGVRARQADVVFVCAEERTAFDRVWDQGGNGPHRLIVSSRDGLSELTPISSKANGVTFMGTVGRVAKAVRQIAAKDLVLDESTLTVLPLSKATKANSSAKAVFAGRLAILAGESDGLFEAPGGVALPHGLFQAVVQRRLKEYTTLVEAYDEAATKEDGSAEKCAKNTADFIREGLPVSEVVVQAIQKGFPPDTRVMVRSSANAEDLETMSGAGLYDSIANVSVHNTVAVREAVAKVWASLWTKRAASSRTTYDVPHARVSMAVLIQEMVSADVSFVAFSRDPVGRGKSSDVYVEMAVGMGETLASATADGSPYRFRVRRDGFVVRTVAMASYSEALVPKKGTENGEGLQSVVVHYDKEKLTTDERLRETLVERVARTVVLLEKELGGPQDVEGAIRLGDGNERPRVFIVQARPQIL